MKNALFWFNGIEYTPGNKDAVGACAILSKVRLKYSDMVIVRSKGFNPMLMNGEAIGHVDERV